MRVWGAGKLGAIGLGAVLLLGAYSSSGSDSITAAPTTKAKPTTTTTVPKPTDEAALRKLAIDWYATEAELVQHPNPDDKRLTTFLAGEYLRRVRTDHQKRLDEHLAARAGSPSRAQHWIESVSVNGNAATIVECSIDDWLLTDARSNTVLNNEVVAYESTTQARREAGSWRLIKRRSTETRGVSGCALDH